MIDAEDFLVLVDRAFGGMVDIVSGLGDERANTRPEIPGANSPYALLFHCVALTSWWAGHVVLGEEIPRQRASELSAAGRVGPLIDRVPAARDRLAAVVRTVEAGATVRGQVADHYVGTPIGTRAGAALMHVYEELARHHGQMEVIADVLRSGDRRPEG